MKKTQIALLCALTLIVVGSIRAVEEGRKEGKATVRSVHGTVEYLDNSVWLPVRPNMKFDAGITIRTGSDGMADLSVNGFSSAVRITNNTTLQIPTMTYVGTAREGDTTTMLNLVSGSVLGNVKKITKNSRYEIMTPHGVAGVRGTDFGVSAILTEDHKWTVTFNSITGTITVSAVINGVTVTHTLTTGTSWVIGENPKPMTPEAIQAAQSEILNLVTAINNIINLLTPHLPNVNQAGPNPNSPANPVTPFQAGPPQGPQPAPPSGSPQGPPASP
jgi:hypothetical protein